MVMIATREFEKLDTNTIADYMDDARFRGSLTESEFDQIISILLNRDLHPEALALYLGFGKPEWRKKFN
jgi:hypothetical protein